LPRDMKTNFDYCDLDSGTEDVKHSSTTGYFSSSIISSPIEVDL